MSERSQLRGRLAEAALILASILLAFAIDAAWEDRQARLLREEVISVATLEAAANMEQLELTVSQTEDRLRQIDVFFAMTLVPGTGERLDSVSSIILALPNAPSIQPSLSGALMLAQTPLLDLDDIVVRSAVDRWLQEVSGAEQRNERLQSAQMEVVGLLAAYAIPGVSDGMQGSIPSEVATSGADVLDDIRADERIVTAVVRKAHYQNRYLVSLRQARIALDSLIDALAAPE